MTRGNAFVVQEDELIQRIFDVTADVRQSVSAVGEAVTGLRSYPGIEVFVAAAAAAFDGLRCDLAELAALCAQLRGLSNLTIDGARLLGAAEATAGMVSTHVAAFDAEFERLARTA